MNHPSRWSRSSLVSLSFGYEIRATLLQLAQAFSIIINDGKLVPFKIIYDTMSNDQIASEPLYSTHAVTAIKKILEKTVAQPIEGYNIWGKTGTANLVINGEYAPEHNIYTFAGVLEKDTFKRLIVTFIKDAQRKDLRAATVAVSLFDQIVQDLLMHETIHCQGTSNA